VTPQFKATATLARDPIACRALGGAWILVLEMRQPSEPEPITGAWQFGHGEPAAQAAHSAAARLRQGHQVTVYFSGLGIGHTRDNTASIELRGISSVQALPATAPPPAPFSAANVAAKAAALKAALTSRNH
jgi:hypothetical protein